MRGNMNLKNIKLVTFDATNTLLKFRQPPWQYYAKMACEHGFQISPDSLKAPLKDSFKIMWKQYPNFGKSKIAWKDWWREVVKLTFRDILPSNIKTEPIANKLIEEFTTSKCWCIADGGDVLVNLLKKQGIPVGVISNFDPRLKDILKNVGMHKYFDFIITSYDVGASKPDIRIFEIALKKPKGVFKPFEALHIGDDVRNDYEGARAAGWHALLVNPNLNTETPPARNHVFVDLEHLVSTIDQNSLIL